MCKEAMWRVRAFLNPLFQEGRAVEGENAVSINLEGRKPLVDHAGNPVRMWKKDEEGKKIGTEAVPIQPDHHLHLRQNQIRLD